MGGFTKLREETTLEKYLGACEDVLSKITEINKIIGGDSGDRKYYLEQIQGFMKNFASMGKFQMGDKVELSKTPDTSIANAPGWHSYRHFLVKGAHARIVDVDFYGDSFRYDLKFDRYSWMDSDDKVRKASSNDSGAFTLKEEFIAERSCNQDTAPCPEVSE